MSSTWRHYLSLFGRWPRWCIAGSCLLLALNSAVGSGGGVPSEPTVAMVVAARELDAGHVLRAPDLRLIRVPAAARPDSARGDPATLLGQRLTGPLRPREPVTTTRLLGRDLTLGLSPDLVAVPIMLADPHAAELVHGGDRVDLLATQRPSDGGALEPTATGGAVIPIATRVRVLAVFTASEKDSAEVVVAASREVALRLARERPLKEFTAVAVPP